MSKSKFCHTRVCIRVHRVAESLVLKDRHAGKQIGANCVNSPSFFFLLVWELVSVPNKDFN